MTQLWNEPGGPRASVRSRAGRRRGRRQRGQGLVEYALILALIGILAIASVTYLGTSIHSVLSNVGDAFGNHGPAATAAPTAWPTPTATPQPINTLKPTKTPKPIKTPKPKNTKAPKIVTP